jgi:branched-chain amino acid transport system substrate-binding protein
LSDRAAALRLLWRGAPALVVLCALLGGGLGRAATPAGPPVEINVILSLTGSGTFQGMEESTSLALLEAYVNAGGGIRGRPLRFAIADDTSNPQVAVQLANQLIAKNASVILGPALTSTCNAVNAITMKNGPVTYCISPGIHPPAGTFAYSSTVAARDELAIIVRYFRERGLRRIAAITSTDATGQDVDQSVQLALARPENAGVELVAQEHFNQSDVSVAAQMARIKAAAPQAIVAWSTGPPFATLLRGMKDVGLDIPTAAGGGNEIYAQLESYVAFMPKELYFGGLASMHGFGPLGVQRMARAYLEAFKAAGDRPDGVSYLAWDPALIIVDAFRRLGTDATAAQIHDFIAQLHDWSGADGLYDFRVGDQRGIGMAATIVERWDPVAKEFLAASKPEGHVK